MLPAMTRAAFIVGGLAVALAAILPAAAAEHASGPAHATIVDPMSVRMTWSLAMPSVQGGAQGASFQGTMPSMGMGMMMPGNARLTVRREDDTGEPVTAPTSFEVVTTEGDEALTIRTGGAAELKTANMSVIVGGALLGGAAASIEVGRGLILASTGPDLTPQPATLVVVVQYN